jgi:hypothetical protein
LAKYLGEGTSLKEAEEKSSAFLFFCDLFVRANHSAPRFVKRLLASQILSIQVPENVTFGKSVRIAPMTIGNDAAENAVLSAENTAYGNQASVGTKTARVLVGHQICNKAK